LTRSSEQSDQVHRNRPSRTEPGCRVTKAFAERRAGPRDRPARFRCKSGVN
jgi:hypothetical protein